MYTVIYAAAFIYSFLLVLHLLLNEQKLRAEFMLIFLNTLITIGGYMAQSLAQSADEAFLSIRVAYMGNIWLSFFMFLTTARICGVKIHPVLNGLMIVVNCGVQIITWTAGYLPWYYKGLEIFTENGSTHVIKEYGPLHPYFKVFLLLYVAGMLVITIIGFRNKRKVSYKYSVSLLVIEAVNVLIYIVKMFVHDDFEYITFSLIISCTILLFLNRRIVLYDPESVFQKDFGAGDDGYFSGGAILMDNKMHYMGCSEGMHRIIPGLAALKLEYEIPADAAKECLEIVDWINEYMYDGQEKMWIFESGERSYRCTISHYTGKYGNARRELGYVVYVRDDTVTQEHMKAINTYNERLLAQEQEMTALNASLKEAMEEAQQASLFKSAFLSNMSHEIRTPMNAIVGMTDIIMRLDHSPEEEEYLANIKRSGEALLGIINDILDFSKIESGKLELVPGDYNSWDMFDELHMLFRNRIGAKPVELQYDIDPTLPGVLNGDVLRIRQVLINLMGNAVKFTDHGFVRLQVVVIGREEDRIRLSVSVEDSGQGIRREDLGKLFTTFQQVNTRKNHEKEGTGLGLAISRNLVAMMGGELTVSSVYGEGSTFSFAIEQKVVKEERVIEKKRKDDLSKLRAPKATILLVDDNEINLAVATGLMAPLQMQIDTAVNGKDAVRKIDEKHYDLILMDHMMPIMDGRQATEAVRRVQDDYHQNVPIIALTADAVMDAREKMLESGMNGFLSKPIQLGELAKVLRAWLPEGYIYEVTEEEAGQHEEPESPVTEEERAKLEEAGIDVEAGVESTGSGKLWRDTLTNFYKLIDVKRTKIRKLLDDSMIRDFTIEVHALKNTSRLIGKTDLSERFKELEALGNRATSCSTEEEKEKHESLLAEIREKAAVALAQFEGLKPALREFAAKGAKTKQVSREQIGLTVSRLRQAMDEFDLDEADVCMKELEGYEMPEECVEIVERLSAYVADVAMEDVMQLCDELLQKL